MICFLKELGCVIIGGIIGTLVRSLITLQSFSQNNLTLYNWQIVCLNIGGCFFAGFLVTLFRNKFNHLISALLYIGFLGSLTSFADFIFFVNNFILQKQIMLALMTFFITTLGALLTFYLGCQSAKLFSKNKLS